MADSLRFDVVVPATARAGDAVPVTLRLTNGASHPTDAHFLGRTIAFDIVVTAEDGTVVWRRLVEGAVPSILQIRTLAPGEVMTWTDVWRPVAAGTYRVQGLLPSDAKEPRRTPWVSLVISP